MGFIVIGVLVIFAVLALGGASAAQVNMQASFYKSDGSLTGLPITNDPSTWPGDSAIWNICAACAMAEGYNQGPGFVPYDLNNPGDLSDWASTYGSQPHSGSNVTTFPTAETGWNALWNKWTAILAGKSTVYPATWTWAQIGAVWAGNSVAWINNVTSYLGVDPGSTPAQYVASQGVIA